MASNQHTPTVASAASRVFDVAELLEHILLQLRPATATNTVDTKSGDDGEPDSLNDSETPSCRSKTTKGNQWSDGIEDLFVVQRVCRQWKIVIQGSVNLRRAMLLEYADPNDANADQKYGLEYLLDPNTAALKLHPALPCIQELVDNIGLNGKQQKLVRLRFSERKGGLAFLINSTVSFVGCDGSRKEEGVQCRGKEHILNIAAARAFKPQKLGSNASWRRMKLFAQPTQVQVQMSIKAGFPGAYWRTIIIDDKRSHVGNVYDALEVLASIRFKQHHENGEACWAMMDKLWDGAEAWDGGLRYDSPDVRAALETKTEHDSKFCRVSTGDCMYCSAVAALAVIESDRRMLLSFFAEADTRMVMMRPKVEPALLQKFYESDKENYDDSGFCEADEYDESDKENSGYSGSF